jgi:hypothetical protein
MRILLICFVNTYGFSAKLAIAKAFMTHVPCRKLMRSAIAFAGSLV